MGAVPETVQQCRYLDIMSRMTGDRWRVPTVVQCLGSTTSLVRQVPCERWRVPTVVQCLGSTIRYDTVDLRALKSWRDGQLNLAHGPETKNNDKIKNRVAQKKRCRQKSAEAVQEEEVNVLNEAGAMCNVTALEPVTQSCTVALWIKTRRFFSGRSPPTVTLIH